jgi:16S rRNA (cytidine1402-2'-O)-methyltransferase
LSIDALQIQQAAAAAAAAQQYPAPALYVVATPIGNLADITLRAVHVLSLVDAVACEDSRVAGALLHHLGLHKPLIALHQHNEREAADAVLQHLRADRRVAYATDAGTPAVSDPGAALVQMVSAQSFRVVPIPGASSVIAALSVAGDTGPGFQFCGFAPHKGQERQRALDAACDDAGTQVWLESPHRIASLAEVWAARAADRSVTVCRELTKQFETVVTLAASALPSWLSDDPQRLRGEFVLVLHGTGTARPEDPAVTAAAEHALDVLLGELPLKQAVSLAARISGAPRNALYDLALQRRGADSGAG